MSDNDIIKALEVHGNEEFDNCVGCPYLVGDCCEGFSVYSKPYRDVLDLIKRLKRESNSYRNTARTQKGELARLNKQVAEQKAEIERLQKEKDFELYEKTRYRLFWKELQEENQKLHKICDKAIKTYKETKSEAIKEFQQKSKKELIKLYKKYYRKANSKKEVDIFYQGRAEAMWECICRNDSLVKEMEVK